MGFLKVKGVLATKVLLFIIASGISDFFFFFCNDEMFGTLSHTSQTKG